MEESFPLQFLFMNETRHLFVFVFLTPLFSGALFVYQFIKISRLSMLTHLLTSMFVFLKHSSNKTVGLTRHSKLWVGFYPKLVPLKPN